MPPHSSGMCGSQIPSANGSLAHADQRGDALAALQAGLADTAFDPALLGLDHVVHEGPHAQADRFEFGREGEVDGHRDTMSGACSESGTVGYLAHVSFRIPTVFAAGALAIAAAACANGGADTSSVAAVDADPVATESSGPATTDSATQHRPAPPRPARPRPQHDHDEHHQHDHDDTPTAAGSARSERGGGRARLLRRGPTHLRRTVRHSWWPPGVGDRGHPRRRGRRAGDRRRTARDEPFPMASSCGSSSP